MIKIVLNIEHEAIKLLGKDCLHNEPLIMGEEEEAATFAS
jgi:hypothetical protein